MLTLFAAKGSVAVASALLLEEVGTPYELKLVDMASSEQLSPDYLAINPKGRVPALATPSGVLTETGAVLEYIGADIMPRRSFQAAKVREMVHYLASTMHVNHAHNKRGHRWASDPTAIAHMTSEVPRTMAQSCAYLDGLSAGPYIFGDAITIADPHLFTICQWLKSDNVDVTKYPRLSAFLETYGARSAVAAVKEKGLL